VRSQELEVHFAAELSHGPAVFFAAAQIQMRPRRASSRRFYLEL
jgi:hypothetical protein